MMWHTGPSMCRNHEKVIGIETCLEYSKKLKQVMIMQFIRISWGFI